MSIDSLIQPRQIDQPKIRRMDRRVSPKPEEAQFLDQVLFDLNRADVDHSYKARIRVQVVPSNSKISFAPIDHMIPSAALR